MSNREKQKIVSLLEEFQSVTSTSAFGASLSDGLSAERLVVKVDGSSTAVGISVGEV